MTPASHPRLELLDEIGFLLTRVAAATVTAVNVELTDLGIRVRDYSVLAIAADTGGVSQRQLATLLGLDPSRVVPLVDGLQDRGLIERMVHPQDRRLNVVSVTPAGQEVRDRGRAAAHRGEEGVLIGLSSADVAALRSVLQRLAVQHNPELAITESAALSASHSVNDTLR